MMDTLVFDSGEADSDRVRGFTACGAGAGELRSAVQVVMEAGLPYPVLRDAILTHPAMFEGLRSLFPGTFSTPPSYA